MTIISWLPKNESNDCSEINFPCLDEWFATVGSDGHVNAVEKKFNENFEVNDKYTSHDGLLRALIWAIVLRTELSNYKLLWDNCEIICFMP